MKASRLSCLMFSQDCTSGGQRPEASSNASPDLTSIPLGYQDLDECVSKAKAATLPLHYPYDCLIGTSPPRVFDASHKHGDKSHLCLSLLTSSGLMAVMTVLVRSDHTYLCLIVTFPPLWYSSSPLPSLLCQILFDSSPTSKSLVFIIPRVILTRVLTWPVPVWPVPTGLLVMTPC